jgi:hypothetical protein
MSWWRFRQFVESEMEPAGSWQISDCGFRIANLKSHTTKSLDNSKFEFRNSQLLILATESEIEYEKSGDRLLNVTASEL